MSDKEREYAILSKLSYKAKNTKTLNKELRHYGLADKYSLDPNIKSSNYLMFRNETDGRGVLAYRGTKLSNSGDIYADAAIFFGVENYTTRFRNAVKAAKRARKAYGKDNLDVTGHSLGGSQALHVANELGVEAHAYNPGKGYKRFRLGNLLGPVGSLVQSLMDRKGKLNKNNATIYTTGVDPISMAATRSDAAVKYRTPKSLDVHGIDNFYDSPKKTKKEHKRKALGRDSP